MADAIFGPLITGTDVEDAAIATLQLWLPEYLPWVERKRGLPARSLVFPRSWVTSTEVDRWPEEQLPSVLLVSTGLTGEPTKDGRGNFRAKFDLGLAVVVSARTKKETDARAKLYVAALRSVLLHKQALGGIAQGVEWVDERYDALTGNRKRQLAAGLAVFRVDVADVTAAKSGPRTPRANPYQPYPDPPVATSVGARLPIREVTP